MPACQPTHAFSISDAIHNATQIAKFSNSEASLQARAGSRSQEVCICVGRWTIFTDLKAYIIKDENGEYTLENISTK